MSLKFSICCYRGALALVAALATGFAAAQSPLKANPENSLLDAELFYEILVGEITTQSGDSSAGFALILDAARKSNSSILFERATQIALNARNGDAALHAAQSWVRAFPMSLEANRFLVQILIDLNRAQDTILPIKRALRSMSTNDKRATIEFLPRYFSRLADRKQAANYVEQALSSEVADTTSGPLTWAAIGQMRLLANDTVGAMAAVKRGFSINPAAVAPSALATLALALLDHATPSAEALVISYLSGTPAPDFRFAYIRYLMRMQRNVNAYDEVQKLTQQSPDHADGWLLRGSLEVQDRKFSTAQKSLKKYLQLRASSPPTPEIQWTDRPWVLAHVLLSQASEQDGHFADALEYLQRIDNPADAFRLGVRKAAILAKLGKLDAGLALLRALPDDQPDTAKNKLSAEIQLLQDNKKLQQAYETLEAAVQRFPNDVDLKYDLGMMAEKAGKLDVMEALLREVIVAKPDFHAAYNALGYSLAERNIRLDEARQLISKALEFAPDDPFIVDSMAWLEFRSGNAKIAVKLLQDAFKSRADAEIAAHLGEVLWTMGDEAAATSIWEQGMKINPENETLLETIRRLRGKP